MNAMNMSNDPRSIEKEITRKNRQKALLDTIAGLGVLTMAALTPGALVAVPKLKKMFFRPREKESAYRALRRLEEKGMIRITRSGKKIRVEMTDKGRINLARLGGPSAPKQKRWDGNWRMVIYDIAEKRKVKRMLLHEALRNTGFYRLQDSVWIYPYACDELVVMLKTEYQLGSEVIYAVLKHLENDKKLLEHFRLERP